MDQVFEHNKLDLVVVVDKVNHMSSITEIASSFKEGEKIDIYNSLKYEIVQLLAMK